jgi:N-acetylglucosamine-6-phosphate deacetylase
VEATVLLPEHRWQPARVEWRDGVITGIHALTSAPPRRLVPGFVDLQVNGIEDIDVAGADGSDWERLDRLLLAQGVTSWCPTLVTSPLGAYARPLARIADAARRRGKERPHLVGAHLEGPFLGGAAGAHRPELIIPIDLQWLADLPQVVKVLTLGPEQPLALEAIRLLTRNGCLVALGHTHADEHRFDAAVAAGARLTTHLFNGMTGVHHRNLGVAAAALTNDSVAASLIADGVHVHPRVLRLAFATLGIERAVLVTDSVAWRRGAAGPVSLQMRDGAPRLADGTLAGSALTMDTAVRTCVAAGIALEHACAAASANPARLLRLGDRGAIRVGARADLVALAPDLQIEQVWVGGAAVPR